MSTTLTLAKPAWHRMAAEKAQQAISQNTPLSVGLLSTIIGAVIAIAAWMFTNFGDLKSDVRLMNSQVKRIEDEVQLIKNTYPTTKEINLRFDILESKIDQLKSVKK